MHVNGLQSKFSEDDDSDRLGPGLPRSDVRGQTLPDDAGLLRQSVRQAPGTYAGLGSPDLIVTAGGGIMAHPDGPAAGVAGLREAWEAAMAGISLADYAREHQALGIALAARAA